MPTLHTLLGNPAINSSFVIRSTLLGGATGADGMVIEVAHEDHLIVRVKARWNLRMISMGKIPADAQVIRILRTNTLVEVTINQEERTGWMISEETSNSLRLSHGKRDLGAEMVRNGNETSIHTIGFPLNGTFSLT